ncbi:MAG: tetratricopeptide repeat protein [Candidatus Marinimicrobia bacterium]|nr:tetratricopeptide repeat protein [Candidatus Neomarinimicrobiota bacterium]
MRANKYKINLIDMIMMIGFMAMVILVPLVYSDLVAEITLYPKFIVLALLVLLLSVLWLLKFIFEKKAPSFVNPLTLPILFFLIINIVSLNAAVNVNASLFPLAQLFTLIILFFILVNFMTQTRLELLLKVWVITGGVVAVIGICQYLGIGLNWIPSAGNPSSTFAYRNNAAMFLILTLPIGGFLFLTSQKIKNEVIWGFCTSLMFIFLIYTRTRGAWVGLTGATFFSIMIYIILKKNRPHAFIDQRKHFKSRTKRIICLVCIGFIISMSFLDPNIEDLGGKKSEIFSTVTSIIDVGGQSARLGIWKASWDMFADGFNWLTGVGLNNWTLLYPAYAQGHLISFTTIVNRPHNDLIWILTETGIVGFFIYTWLLLTVAYMVFIIIKHNTKLKTVLLTISLSTSLLAILGHSLFSFPKERIAISMLFWMIIAFLTYIYNQLPKQSRSNNLFPFKMNSRDLSKALNYVILIGMLVISTISVEVARRHLLSDFHFKKGYFYFEREVYPGAIQEFNRAEEFWYNSWKSSYFLGLSYLKSQNLPASISSFKRCLTYSPYFFNAHYNLGVAYSTSGNFLEAIKHFAYTIVIKPDFAKGYYNLGISWHKFGNEAEAEKNYRLSLLFDPKLPQVYNNLGSILKNRKEYEEALTHFEKALEIDPHLPEALRNLDSLLLILDNSL